MINMPAGESELWTPELWTPEQSLEESLPNPWVMGTIHAAARLVLHPRVVFEKGAIDQIQQDREDGISYLILMTHFSRMEVLHIADVANTPSLKHIRINTGITARDDLFNLAEPAGYIVRHSGAHPVARSIENPNLSAEENQRRKLENQQTQYLGAVFLANGKHWLVFPEGGSKYIVRDEDNNPVIGPDGKVIREQRKPDSLLPLQYGFVHTTEYLSDEQQQRTKYLGMVARYPQDKFGLLHPTIVVTIPETPSNGSSEDKLLQGTRILQRGLDIAVQYDENNPRRSMNQSK